MVFLRKGELTILKNKKFFFVIKIKMIGQPNQFDATPIVSVSFTSKLAFYIPKFDTKKTYKNLKVPAFLKLWA